MDGVAVLVSAGVGVVGGYLSGLAADRIGAARYGPGTAGHDPDDADLAPLEAPTSPRQRVVLAGFGAAGMAALAAGIPVGEVLIPFGVLFIVYLAAMVVDLQYLRLPNAFTYPAAAFAVLAGVVLSARFDIPLIGTWLGLLSYAGFLLFMRVAYQLIRGREGMGLGDVKLALSLGASLGWLGAALVYNPDPGALLGTPPGAGAVLLVVYAALIGNLLGAVGGTVLVRRLDREFPFGPALVAGWVIVVALSERLAG